MSSAAADQKNISNKAATTDAADAASSYGAASGDIGQYMSNVNSALSAGNPFEAKDYLTQQNLQTSGAMNAENDAEKQALGSTVARTGTNTAALANTVASGARQGQRDLTQYNAGRDTSNENTWLNQQDKLLNDQARGASEEAGLYGTALNGQNNSLSTAAKLAEDENAATNGWINKGIDAGTALVGGF